jgi:NADPH:quinone reductase-like Zn-dependent oxidoreductase
VAPGPGSGELLVDVEAAGINYLDVYLRRGTHGATLPLCPGLEGVDGYVRSGRGGCFAESARRRVDEGKVAGLHWIEVGLEVAGG